MRLHNSVKDVMRMKRGVECFESRSGSQLYIEGWAQNAVEPPPLPVASPEQYQGYGGSYPLTPPPGPTGYQPYAQSPWQPQYQRQGAHPGYPPGTNPSQYTMPHNGQAMPPNSYLPPLTNHPYGQNQAHQPNSYGQLEQQSWQPLSSISQGSASPPAPANGQPPNNYGGSSPPAPENGQVPNNYGNPSHISPANGQLSNTYEMTTSPHQQNYGQTPHLGPAPEWPVCRTCRGTGLYTRYDAK
jgi:hypothetical protein